MDERTKNPLDESRAVHGRDAETANLDADNLDGLVDNALGTYTAGEPRRDLSTRILRAAHAFEPRQRSSLQHHPTRPWTFAVAGWLAAAAMLLVCINASNLQIIVQPRPAATQLALNAPPTLSHIPTTTSSSFKAAPAPPGPEQPAPRRTHFRHAIRASVSNTRALPTDRIGPFQPLAFAPIVLAPIGSEERN
jgi:hypothetical protein